MSSESETKPTLPLEELELTPEWVKVPAPSYRGHEGEKRDDRKRGAGFRDRPRGPRPDRPPREERRQFRDAGERRQRAPVGKAPPPQAKTTGPPRRRGKQRRPPMGARRPGPPREQRPVESPVEVTFLPEEKAFASIIDTMKQSPCAYAFFDVAKLILNKPERHQVKVVHKPVADGSRPPLYLVPATENVFLSQEEALRAIFRHQLNLVCKEMKTTIDAPKGNFLFVNRCGLTGVLLGPPNYHEYQSRLIRHHQQRLAHMPFEKFKANIQTIKDPEAVKAWADSMSVKTQFECVLDTEPTKFGSIDELQKHVIARHADKLVSAVPEAVISGHASRKLEHAGIHEAIRSTWHSERRFPLKTANQLQARLRQEGFHFFKRDKAITYVTAIRPRRFEAGQDLTEHVRRIIAFLRTKENCRWPDLLAHFLAPAAPADQPIPDGQQPAPATDADGKKQIEELLLADLKWLIQDGYVVEFVDGRLWALEERLPKPPPATPEPPVTPATEPPVTIAEPSSPPQSDPVAEA